MSRRCQPDIRIREGGGGERSSLVSSLSVDLWAGEGGCGERSSLVLSLSVNLWADEGGGGERTSLVLSLSISLSAYLHFLGEGKKEGEGEDTQKAGIAIR